MWIQSWNNIFKIFFSNYIYTSMLEYVVRAHTFSKLLNVNKYCWHFVTMSSFYLCIWIIILQKRNNRIRGRKKPRVEWSNSFLMHRGQHCNYIFYICFVNSICQVSAKNMLMVKLCLLLWVPRCLFCFISQLRTLSL